MVEFWTSKKKMGDEDENDREDKNGDEKSSVQYAWLCVEPSGTLRIRTLTCRFAAGQLSHTWNSLTSQFLMMIAPITSDPSISCTQLYHLLRIPS